MKLLRSEYHMAAWVNKGASNIAIKRYGHFWYVGPHWGTDFEELLVQMVVQKKQKTG